MYLSCGGGRPGLPFERFRYDINPEMRFAARLVAGMAFMQMGLIRNVEAFRRESFVQLICDCVLTVMIRAISCVIRQGQ
jgi:hypothetical protein